MPEIQQIIDDAAEISGNISFPEVVKGTTGYRVVPLDLNNPDDKQLFREIEKAAKDFITYVERTGTRFRGNRINEIGKKIEEVFVGELKKTNLIPKKLSKSGYPDIQILDSNNCITYLESKATSKDWSSTFRSFYYTNGNKIKSDAHHLLIGWKIEEETGKYWKVVGWKLCDLAKLNSMLIKVEFNQGNSGIYCSGVILSESK